MRGAGTEAWDFHTAFANSRLGSGFGPGKRQRKLTVTAAVQSGTEKIDSSLPASTAATTSGNFARCTAHQVASKRLES
jgi:hypothetical protein